MEEYNTFLEGFANSPNTLKSYKNAIDKFLEYFRIDNIDDINDLSVIKCEKYKTYLKSTGLESSSVNTFIRPVKAFLYWLTTMEIIKRNPFEKVKYLKPDEDKVVFFLTDEESLAMINSCKNDQDKMIISFFLYEGLRREELCSIKMEDFIIDSKEIHLVVHGKGRKERVLLISPEIQDDLLSFFKNRRFPDNEYLFVSPFNKKFSNSTMLYKVKSIGKRAGINEDRLKKLTPHKLRHTFCSELGSVSNDDRAAQEAMGHANVSTTEIYTHLKNNAVDKAMRKIKYGK